MENPVKRNLANAVLIALALFYIVMLGGGNYEHMNITRVVASAPPKSMSMLQGPYGFSPVKFWVTFRPLTILLFIAALIANWNYSPFRRKLLLIAFGIDFATNVATFLYFAPETGTIAGAAFHENLVDQDLLQRAQLWKNLNLVRLGAFYAGAILMLVALTGRHGLPSRLTGSKEISL